MASIAVPFLTPLSGRLAPLLSFPIPLCSSPAAALETSLTLFPNLNRYCSSYSRTMPRRTRCPRRRTWTERCQLPFEVSQPPLRNHYPRGALGPVSSSFVAGRPRASHPPAGLRSGLSEPGVSRTCEPASPHPASPHAAQSLLVVGRGGLARPRATKSHEEGRK